mgnify:CR=1 FL=1
MIFNLVSDIVCRFKAIRTQTDWQIQTLLFSLWQSNTAALTVLFTKRCGEYSVEYSSLDMQAQAVLFAQVSQSAKKYISVFSGNEGYVIPRSPSQNTGQSKAVLLPTAQQLATAVSLVQIHQPTVSQSVNYSHSNTKELKSLAVRFG